jgi:hypothetical protein
VFPATHTGAPPAWGKKTYPPGPHSPAPSGTPHCQAPESRRRRSLPLPRVMFPVPFPAPFPVSYRLPRRRNGRGTPRLRYPPGLPARVPCRVSPLPGWGMQAVFAAYLRETEVSVRYFERLRNRYAPMRHAKTVMKGLPAVAAPGCARMRPPSMPPLR